MSKEPFDLPPVLAKPPRRFRRLPIWFLGAMTFALLAVLVGVLVVAVARDDNPCCEHSDGPVCGAVGDNDGSICSWSVASGQLLAALSDGGSKGVQTG